MYAIHGAVDRVAAACHDLVGAESRLDPGPAAAAVLLALVADDTEGPLHHVDLLCLLELARHGLEIVSARAARLVGLVDDLDYGMKVTRLILGDVDGLPPLRRGRASGRGSLDGSTAPIAVIAEPRVIRAGLHRATP